MAVPGALNHFYGFVTMRAAFFLQCNEPQHLGSPPEYSWGSGRHRFVSNTIRIPVKPRIPPPEVSVEGDQPETDDSYVEGIQ
jgi:hypothetical protein